MSSDLCGKLEIDIEIKASAEQYYHMWKYKPHHISKFSDKVQGCKLHEGEWGTVGSVLIWNYSHEGQYQESKELIEAIDDEKNSITFKVLKGTQKESYKDVKCVLQCTPKSDGQGSIVHWTIIYERCNGENVDDTHTFLDSLRDVTKDIEAHLLEES